MTSAEPITTGELLRWLYRHQGTIEFKREGGHDYLVVRVPGQPAGEVHQREWLVRSPLAVVPACRGLVEDMRRLLCLE